MKGRMLERDREKDAGRGTELIASVKHLLVLYWSRKGRWRGRGSRLEIRVDTGN